MFSVVYIVFWVSFASVSQQFLQQGGFNGFNLLINANNSGSSWEILWWFNMLMCLRLSVVFEFEVCFGTFLAKS